MSISPFGRFLFLALSLLAAAPASAHIIYFGRDFGTLTGVPFTRTIANQTAETNYGWADGTDPDWASAHLQTYFKFTLQAQATITITVASNNPATFSPGFSLYRGVGTTSPPDYDEDNITVDYLISLGAPLREGAFDALHTWKIGNDNDNSFADMTTFTYIGNAADGTSANFGTAPGINGDGVKDGFITGTFTIAAGTYTIAVGGAEYYSQVDMNNHSFNTTLVVVPEGSISGLAFGGLAFLGSLRLRVRGGKRSRGR